MLDTMKHKAKRWQKGMYANISMLTNTYWF